MASVDDIFKSSGISGKRKLDPIRDPNEIYKSAKINANGSNRHAQVNDAPDEDEDMEAGPAPPPADDEDFGPELPPDDDEGRFFGGGITKQESEILDYVEEADAGRAPEKIDAAWLRKTLTNLEKHINKNAELRAKFEDQPQKFIGSEADLDADIKGLSLLSEHPELYPEFVKLECVASVVGLLAHENTDIAIDAIEIMGELTDEDVAAEDEQWNVLVDAMMEADLLSLLVSNFSRLNEDDESDRNGIYHALGLIENLCSRQSVAERVGEDEKLLQWLLQRIQRKEDTVSQNKQYAAEILAILAQMAVANRTKLINLDAVDLLLQLIAPYRRRDPDKGGDEEEYMENIFASLTCLADEAAGKAKFIDAEGVELCLIMLKEGKKSKPPALRLLNHAAGGNAGVDVCQKIVEAGGLKGLFTLFMKTQDHRLAEHLVEIFASMLRLLPANSAERIRTLAKFVEKDYEKISKLIKFRRDYVARVSLAEQQNDAEKATTSEDDREAAELEWLSRRIDAGLFTLQTIDTVLAWLVAEDTGAARKIRQILAERDEKVSVIGRTLKEQLDGLDTTEENQDLRDMLSTLVEFVQ
ncbi:related to nuclear associated protein [Fusarium oxysporum]|uniref:Beta-catenin-like protein 1 n=1 Tax=Fusarium oxysporum TaxID=5507 RepID=A0A2H3SKX9_FUSOX|nr:Catenin-beta-like protein [Fusarium oxysporum]RKK85777.1 Beta-catenin-like protein 1 [Fusarium oxysporum]SCO77086.1 related to nuclear associated protein [Fusarium oxysporum]